MLQRFLTGSDHRIGQGRVDNEGVLVVVDDRRLGAWCLEPIRFMGSKHLDLEPTIILFDVTDRDTLPEDGFAIAFERPAKGYIVKQFDRVGFRSQALAGKLVIPVAVKLVGPECDLGGLASDHY